MSRVTRQRTRTIGLGALTVVLAATALIATSCEDMGVLSARVDEIVAGGQDERSDTSGPAAGILVSPITGLFTTEDGGTAEFQISLASQPSAAVTIPIESKDENEGTADIANLVIMPELWSAPRTVVVTGADDALIDGDVPYTIELKPAQSDDSAYAGIDPQNVVVTNRDNDGASIIVDPTDGLMTSESGGTDTFTVVLSSQPTDTVTIPVSSGNPLEGLPDVDQIIFTADTWGSAQTITVTGVDDDQADDDQDYTIVLGAADSQDDDYDGKNPPDVAVVNVDNDVPGITVSQTSGLATTEAGGTDAFTVVLSTQPTMSVTIPVVSSDTTETTVSPSLLTFTTTNWGVAQTVTVTGQNDDVDDGNVPFTIQLGAIAESEPSYNGMDPPDPKGSNADDDTAGFVVSRASGLLVYEDTSHSGQVRTFTVRLTSRPSGTSSVTVPVTSSDTTEATVSPAQITFTTSNWSTNQTVTVTGVDDTTTDGSIAFSARLGQVASGDSAYNGMNPPDVAGSNAGETRTAATPTVSPASDTYYVHQACTMSTSTSGATIRYNLGTSAVADPTASSTAYGGSFQITAAQNYLKARTFYQDWTASGVTSREIQIPYVRTIIATDIVPDGSRKLDVSYDGSYLYIGDQAGNRLRKFTVSGSLVSGSDISLGGDARDIHWEAGADAIFVTVGTQGRAYDGATRALLNTYSANLYQPSGIGYSSTTTSVYIHDYDTVHGSTWIRKYDPGSAAETGVYGAPGATSVDMDILDDTIYISDGSVTPGRVRRFSLTGSYQGYWTVIGGPCNNIATVTRKVVRFGFPTLYWPYVFAVASVSSGDDIVYQFDDAGALTGQFSVPETVNGITADSNLNIYLLTSLGHLLRYNKNE